MKCTSTFPCLIKQKVCQIDKSSCYGPLVGWPTSLSSNIDSEIIKLAKKEAEGVLAFLCALVVPTDLRVGKEEVVRVADLFSTLAHTVSKKQNAPAKLKSIVM